MSRRRLAIGRVFHGPSIGPVPAVAKLKKRTGLGVEDFDLVEINEAFAAQVLAVLKDIPIPAVTSSTTAWMVRFCTARATGANTSARSAAIACGP